MFYTQPVTFLHWISLVILSASMSLILGAIFWDVPNTDPQLVLNDRQGYHYSVMCIMPWPLLLYMTVAEVTENRKTVERDISDGLYGRFTYIFTKVRIHESIFLRLLPLHDQHHHHLLFLRLPVSIHLLLLMSSITSECWLIIIIAIRISLAVL